MLRAFIGGLIVALIAITIGYLWYGQQRTIRENQAKQIAELNDQIGKLTSDNASLKEAIAKVQDEEGRLARDNDALRKALEQAKLTGKVPNALPYPPK